MKWPHLLFLFTFLKHIIKFITISQCTRLYFVNVISAYDRNESFFFVYCNLGPISSLHMRTFKTLSSFFVFRLFVVFFFYDFFFVSLFSWVVFLLCFKLNLCFMVSTIFELLFLSLLSKSMKWQSDFSKKNNYIKPKALSLLAIQRPLWSFYKGQYAFIDVE